MTKDAKTWGLVAVLFAMAILFLLLFRKKQAVGVALRITEPGFENEAVHYEQNRMNAALVRICHYSSKDVLWPLDTPCAPKYEGETLTSDEIIRRIG